MSDNRSITGHIGVTSKDNVASTAYDMALQLWVKQYGSQPKADDTKFVFLVGTCTKALGGNVTLNILEDWVKYYDAM